MKLCRVKILSNVFLRALVIVERAVDLKVVPLN
jgi:hypothetical protein